MLIKYIPVEGGHQVQVLLRKVFLYIFILDWGLPPVYELHFLRNDVHRGDMVVLAQQRRDAQAHVAGAGDGDLDIFFALHCLKTVSPMGAIKDYLAAVLESCGMQPGREIGRIGAGCRG